jgi:hypothetical protein
MQAATAITDAERTSAGESRMPFINPSSDGALASRTDILVIRDEFPRPMLTLSYCLTLSTVQKAAGYDFEIKLRLLSNTPGGAARVETVTRPFEVVRMVGQRFPRASLPLC